MDMSSTAGIDPITIRVVRTVEKGLVQAIDRLVPQLSDAASVPGRWELEQMLAEPGMVLLIAEYGTVVVGMLALVVFRTPTGVRARIDDLVEAEDARSFGVIDRLVRRALKTAVSRGARTVQATCPPSNAHVCRLYERLGFERRSTNLYRYKLSG